MNSEHDQIKFNGDPDVVDKEEDKMSSEKDHKKFNDDPYVVGKWEMIETEFMGAATHTALLPGNKVFAYGGSSLDRRAFKHPPPAEILDLDTMQTRRISMQGVEGDLWCGGHTLLEDGKLMFVGGTYEYPPSGEGAYKGLDHAYTFDPFTEQWVQLDNMLEGRWYPTVIRLADNTVLSIAGLPKGEEGKNLGLKDIIQKNQEIYRPGQGWVLMDEKRMFPLYPRLHLLSNGDVFYSGVFNTHFFLPGLFPSMRWKSGKGWRKVGGHHKDKSREEGVSLLLALRPEDNYAERIMVAGGGNAALFRGLTAVLQRLGKSSWIEKLRSNKALNSVDLIDLSEDNPRWQQKASMHKRRIHGVGVLLPDGAVLVVGGMTRHGHVEGTQIEKFAVRSPEMYDPVDDVWHLLPPQQKNRVYHSTALLLPDGRVISMGSNPHPGHIEKSIEIYSPPYLFWGDRPVILEYPEKITYDQTFNLKVDNTRHISQVVLRRLDVLTHVTNTDQRLLELTCKVLSDEKLEVDGPLKREHMPQGYCLLFVISKDGVPSEGKFVLVQ